MIINFEYKKDITVCNCDSFIESVNNIFKNQYVEKVIQINGLNKKAICRKNVTGVNYPKNSYQYAIIFLDNNYQIICNKNDFKKNPYVFELDIENNIVILNDENLDLTKYYTSIQINNEIKLDLNNLLDKQFLFKYLNNIFKNKKAIDIIKDETKVNYKLNIFQGVNSFIFNSNNIKTEDVYLTKEYTYVKYKNVLYIFNNKKKLG